MRGAEGGGPADRAGAEAGMGARHEAGDGRDTGPRPAPGGVPGTEALLASALRAQEADTEGERRALAAFRAARDAEPARAARTRRRDDWRPRDGRHPGRTLKTALSVLLASLTLGGVAYAAMGGGGSAADDGGPDRTRPPASEDAPARPVATPPGTTPGPGTPPVPATTPPGASASPEASAPSRGSTPSDPSGVDRDTEAQCRVYERLAGKGKALDAAAWQRLVAAAGGAERVGTYCTEQLGLPTGPGPSTGAGNGSGGNDAGNGGTGDTGAETGADGIVGEGGVGLEAGDGGAAAQLPDLARP
ncbi:hypothetical protein GCM10010330_04010 [Streptomyces tendae]|uniref:hypothetical protein n=1 Tax=Streptomyces tendae TaxID=1932 RepID=UPI001673BF0E|nr:hypothetical protein [Streptomyces tendae]GHA55711.1 hypothetical protein GCM10010330_04010 [Streptomyces tendae]